MVECFLLHFLPDERIAFLGQKMNRTGQFGERADELTMISRQGLEAPGLSQVPWRWPVHDGSHHLMVWFDSSPTDDVYKEFCF